MKLLLVLGALAWALSGCKKAAPVDAGAEGKPAKVAKKTTAEPGAGEPSKTGEPATGGAATPKTNSPLRPVSKRKTTEPATTPPAPVNAEANKTTTVELPTLPSPVEGNATTAATPSAKASLLGSWQTKADDKFVCTLTFSAGGKGRIRLQDGADSLNMDITWSAEDDQLTLSSKNSKTGKTDTSAGTFQIDKDQLELQFADETHVLTRKL